MGGRKNAAGPVVSSVEERYRSNWWRIYTRRVGRLLALSTREQTHLHPFSGENSFFALEFIREFDAVR